MDEERAKIQEDLRGLLSCEVHCDDVFLQMYASDASIYQILPLGVIRPHSTEDVVACVKYAREHHYPLHARGAGTGLAGESLGRGLVLDFSHSMRRVLWYQGNQVRIQPGVTLHRLNRFLKTHGQQFPIDPANRTVTTMGSVISLDAAGSHSLKYGTARDYVESMQVVLSDGQIIELKRGPQEGLRSGEESIPQRLAYALREEFKKYERPLRRYKTKVQFNRSGYAVWESQTEESVDLCRLLVGSEGTLALITEMTLRTVPLPKSRAVSLLFFQSLERAATAALEVKKFSPSACDLLDRRLLSLARDTDSRFELLIPANVEAALLVEQEGDSQEEVREKLQAVVERICYDLNQAFDSREAYDEKQVHLFWQLAQTVVPTLYRMKGNTRPIPVVEDFAVPPESLPEFTLKLQNILKKHQVTASLFAHAGHGQLHVRPFFDLTDPQDVRTVQALANDLYSEVFRIGGTISGEHGDGLSRTPFVEKQYGDVYPLFREIKRIFDPHNIYNPGKIVGDDPFATIRSLRTDTLQQQKVTGQTEEEAPPTLVTLQLDWIVDEVVQASRLCNGCGQCRSTEQGTRMCPIFHFAPAEEASPRAKANLMRASLAGNLSPETMVSDDFKNVMDLCVNCKMCRLECPASVDIPRLVLEAKAEYVAHHGLRSTDWLLTRLPELSAFASLISPVSNWVLTNPQARWLLEKVWGLAQGRKLPQYTSRPFLSRAARRGWTRPIPGNRRKVVFFVDLYPNYFDPELAEAVVAVLRKNGIPVFVHPGQIPSGMQLISLGAVDRARKVAKHNVALLAEAVRKGYDIITAEPSAVLCLQEEYPAILDDPDADLVAKHSYEIGNYLWNLHREGGLRLDMKPIARRLFYHEPCHQKALGNSMVNLQLLRLIPELEVITQDLGCSGMAGTFGLMQKNYRMSLRAGWQLISQMREDTIQGGTTECSSCKMQMEQGTRKPTIHPMKLLALSYGMMPEIEQTLTTPGDAHTVT
ncbi:Anaerobic glycerol-3-phosphate dehydrogenase subunit C [Planctomycetales bacterium 10988]|nr:Anaerobic glycerol-3-phosphate dehydrogenase subunit C [Planctomycetales bacterium 10988]